MIWDLTPRERARVFLAVTDALKIPDKPETIRDRSRSEFAEAITERDPVEVFATLAVASDIALETCGHDYWVTASAVAEAYAIDTARARHALKLTGWMPACVRDRWESHSGATTEWIPEETDMLSEQFE